MKRFLCLVMTMTLLAASAARGEDVTVITNPADGSEVTITTSYIQLETDMEAAAQVTVAVADGQGRTIHQQHYGTQEDYFQSDAVYLPMGGQPVDYTAVLTLGEEKRTILIHRALGRLMENRACAVGYPLSELTGTGGWRSATLLDLSALTTLTVPLHASNACAIGTATFTLAGGQLTVTADIDPAVNATLRSAAVQAAFTALDAKALGTRDFRGQTGGLGSGFHTQGAQVAAVYVELTLDYDPAGAQPQPQATLPGQAELWETMLSTTVSESVG